MTYVYVTNEKIEEITLRDLGRIYPNMSFPREPSKALLEQYNIYELKPVEPPVVDVTQKIVSRGTPIWDGQQYIETWEITDKSLNEKSRFIRNKRNKLLAETDWMALTDNTLSPEWAAYRQALRDITSQPGFPDDVEWPTPPVDTNPSSE